jgi:hypothetical protein
LITPLVQLKGDTHFFFEMEHGKLKFYFCPLSHRYAPGDTAKREDLNITKPYLIIEAYDIKSLESLRDAVETAIKDYDEQWKGKHVAYYMGDTIGTCC